MQPAETVEVSARGAQPKQTHTTVPPRLRSPHSVVCHTTRCCIPSGSIAIVLRRAAHSNPAEIPRTAGLTRIPPEPRTPKTVGQQGRADVEA
jgi:hypothetical protein